MTAFQRRSKTLNIRLVSPRIPDAQWHYGAKITHDVIISGKLLHCRGGPFLAHSGGKPRGRYVRSWPEPT